MNNILLIFFSSILLASFTLSPAYSQFDLTSASVVEKILVQPGEEFELSIQLSVSPWNHQKWELRDFEALKDRVKYHYIAPHNDSLGSAGLQKWIFTAPSEAGIYSFYFSRTVSTINSDVEKQIKVVNIHVQ